MKKEYKINTEDLLALCHILDEYTTFNKKIEKEINPQNNRKFILKIWEISQGELVFQSKKEKQFYKENKEIIDTINKYSNIYRFINYNYDNHGKPDEKLTYFFNYFSKNRNNINKIVEVLEKLKELGFTRITFNEKINFNEEYHALNPVLKENTHITYVANPIVTPNYTEQIRYKSNNSNYKIKFRIFLENEPLSIENITLNSLIFDIDTLPKSRNTEDIFNPLLKAKKEQSETTKIIRNSVKLNVTISDLENQLKITQTTINSLDNVGSRSELLELLINIKTEIEKLKTLGINYNDEVTQNGNITSELLDKEKTLYLNRREFSKIDLC